MSKSIISQDKVYYETQNFFHADKSVSGHKRTHSRNTRLSFRHHCWPDLSDWGKVAKQPMARFMEAIDCPLPELF